MTTTPHNQDSVNLDKLRKEADAAVSEQDGQWSIEFDKPIQGLDMSKTYDSKELAVDAAFNALKSHQKAKA